MFFHFLHENTVKEFLQRGAALSLLETRWPLDANRSLALLRYWNGNNSASIQRPAPLICCVMFRMWLNARKNADGPSWCQTILLREVMKDIFTGRWTSKV